MMSLPAALKVAVLPTPLTTRFPLSVMVPPAVTFRLPVMVEAPKSIPLTSETETFAPVKFALVKSFAAAVLSTMSWPAALNAAVLFTPLTTTFPLSVMFPPAVTLAFPATVMPGKLMPTLSNVRLRSPKIVAGNAGSVAVPEMFLSVRL